MPSSSRNLRYWVSGAKWSPVCATRKVRSVESVWPGSSVSSFAPSMAMLAPCGRLAHGQVEQARDRFHVAHGQAHVAAPDIGHRNSAAVVGRGHAERVALIEVRLQRLHPVASVLVRGAGEAPEAAGRVRQFVRRAAPADHFEGSLTLVQVVNLHHGKAGQALEERDFHALLDAVFGLAGDDVAAAGAVARVLQVLVRVTREGERVDRPVLEQKRLTRLIRSERLSAQEHAGLQGAVEEEGQGIVRGDLLAR